MRRVKFFVAKVISLLVAPASAALTSALSAMTTTSIAATPAETSAAASNSDRGGPLLSVRRRHTRLDGARGYLRCEFGCALCSRLQRRLSLYGCGNFVVAWPARIHSRPVQSLGWARQRCRNAGYDTKAMRPLFSESQMMTGCLRHCAYCILCSAR